MFSVSLRWSSSHSIPIIFRFVVFMFSQNFWMFFVKNLFELMFSLTDEIVSYSYLQPLRVPFSSFLFCSSTSYSGCLSLWELFFVCSCLLMIFCCVLLIIFLFWKYCLDFIKDFVEFIEHFVNYTDSTSTLYFNSVKSYGSWSWNIFVLIFCFICFSGLLLDTYNCLIFCPLDYYLYVVSLLYFTFNYVSLDGKFIVLCLSILPVSASQLELNPFSFKVVTNQEGLLPVVS